MYDLIGDIHGHADHLKALLAKLGYSQHGDTWAHPERKVLFLGDYIDRGPRIRETLQIVRHMVEAGHAIALMGNHEYNALCFHYPERTGGHLRKHDIKNILQHQRTLEQFQTKQAEYESYLDWFLTLPVCFQGEHFRAVHACWDPAHIGILQAQLPSNRLTEDLIYAAAETDSRLHEAIEITLKGKEIKLVNGLSFRDKDGHERFEIRVKWWLDPMVTSLRDYSIIPIEGLPERPVGHADTAYGPDEMPVFFGHYWLHGDPALYRDNVCCLDYSVAKGGLLAAYRHDGEARLSNDRFVWV